MASITHVQSPADLVALFSSNTYVAIDFFADWCPPCKVITPIFENLSTKYGIPGVLAFAKINVDRSQDLAREYGITAMPTFLFFKEGKQVAVNGQKMVRGADVQSLTAAAEKLGRLAAQRKVESQK